MLWLHFCCNLRAIVLRHVRDWLWLYFLLQLQNHCIKWTGQLHHYSQTIGLTLGVYPALGELLAFFFGMASALFDIRDCILIFILPIRQVCCFLTQTKFRFSLFLFSLHGLERLRFLSLCLFSRGLFGFNFLPIVSRGYLLFCSSCCFLQVFSSSCVICLPFCSAICFVLWCSHFLLMRLVDNLATLLLCCLRYGCRCAFDICPLQLPLFSLQDLEGM